MQKLSEVKAEERQRQKSFVRLFDQTEDSVPSQRSELLAGNTSALFAMGDASHPRSSGKPFTPAQLELCDRECC
jgi:hypothetical protein